MARSPLVFSLNFGTVRRALPEDLRLRAGSQGSKMSAIDPRVFQK